MATTQRRECGLFSTTTQRRREVISSRRCPFCVFRPAWRPAERIVLLAAADLFNGRIVGAPVTHRVKWRAVVSGMLWTRPAHACAACAAVIAAGFDDGYMVRVYRFRTVR